MLSILTSPLAKGWYLALARKGLTALGVYLVSVGALQSSQMNDWLGSGLFLASVVWSLWTEFGHQRRQQPGTSPAAASK